MDRKTLTEAKELEIGDRFYLAGDRDKKIYQIVEHKPRKTKYSTYLFWYCPVLHVNKENQDYHTHPIKENTKVVFLRSTFNIMDRVHRLIVKDYWENPNQTLEQLAVKHKRTRQCIGQVITRFMKLDKECRKQMLVDIQNG